VKKGRNEPNLNQLAEQWLQAKAREEAARDQRVAVEEELFAFVDSKAEGSATTKLDDFKVTVTCRLNRTVDADGITAIEGLIPVEYQPLKTKVELDPKGLQWLKDNAPQYYELAARYVTTKPAKPGFKVERLEKVVQGEVA
jgi:hypothetical protein